MTTDERKAQLEAVQKEIDDLNQQIATADDDGDEKLASHLRDRIHAAKKSFTALLQSGDDQVSDEATDTATDAGAEETSDETSSDEGSDDGNESDEAADGEAASSDEE